MKKLFIIILFFIYSISLLSQHQVDKRILDEANIIINKDTINKILLDQENKYNTGVQILVVTTPDLKDLEPYEYAQKIGKELGVGQTGSNNGIVILIAPNDRKWFIATGYGMEYIITDAECKEIGTECINKLEFKNGIYDPSILRIIDKIHQKIGTISKFDREAWLKKEQDAQKLRNEKKWEYIKTTLLNIFLICIIIGLIFIAIKKIIDIKNLNKEFSFLKQEFDDILKLIDGEIILKTDKLDVTEYLKLKESVKEAKKTQKIHFGENVIPLIQITILAFKETLKGLNEKTNLYLETQNPLPYSKEELTHLQNFRQTKELININDNISETSSLSDMRSFLKLKQQRIDAFKELKSKLASINEFKILSQDFIKIPSVQQAINYIEQCLYDIKLENTDDVYNKIIQAKTDINIWQIIGTKKLQPSSIEKLRIYYNQTKIYKEDFDGIVKLQDEESKAVNNFNAHAKNIDDFESLKVFYNHVNEIQEHLSANIHSLSASYDFYIQEQNRFPSLHTSLKNTYDKYKEVGTLIKEREYKILMSLNFSLDNNKKIDTFISNINNEIYQIQENKRKTQLKKEQEEHERKRKKSNTSSYTSYGSSYSSSDFFSNSSSSSSSSSSSDSFGGGDFGGGGGGGDW